ncbi:UPF0158 family protein [Amycolatopsis sp. NPDC023774]|uniref:UPF0158 family protein n=1 Tax=Amycolatopsis sp. NPDC023774 TaxID=3155015 RepID=UPI003406A095
MLSLDDFNLEGIATALQDQSADDHRHLINPHTGEIEFWTSDGGIDGDQPIGLDELDLIAIGPLPSRVWYEDMAYFAERISDERAGQRLARAIHGKGAFRRFKNKLYAEYPGLLSRWHEFSDIRGQRRAVEWLADNALVTRDTADRFIAEHPDPDLP